MITAAASTAGAAARVGGGATSAAAATTNAVMATPGPGTSARSAGEHTVIRAKQDGDPDEQDIRGTAFSGIRSLGIRLPKPLERGGGLVAFEPPEGRGPRSRPRLSSPSRGPNPVVRASNRANGKEDGHE